jgi:FKBP-type peptidyl-prolyl cis-trans isomerase
MNRTLITLGVVGCVGLLILVGWGLNAEDKKGEEKKDEPKVIKTKSGLEYQDLKEGTGVEAKKGDTVVVHYTGWLKENKKKFDSSLDRGKPFDFELGAGDVIKGWDEGVAGMKVGGKRRLIIPSELGYGKTGKGDIPPNADLVFEVELLKIK